MTAKRDLKRRIRDRAARTGERYTAARERLLAERGGGGGGEAGGGSGGGGGGKGDGRGSGGRGGGARGKVPFIELRDVTSEAAALGIRCPVHVFPELARRIDCTALLRQIRDALRATEGDHRTELLRAAILRGERPDIAYSLADDLLREALLRGALQDVHVAGLGGEAARAPRAIALPLLHNGAFIARAQAGIGGISDNGRLLALHTPGSGGPQMVICQLWHSPVVHPAARAHALILLRPDDFFIALEEAAPAPG